MNRGRSRKAIPLGIPLLYSPPAGNKGYPLSEETLAEYLARIDVSAMRQHGWDDWAAFTSLNRSKIPFMLTWYQNREIFGDGTIDNPRTLPRNS